jgi:hypothetical protein
MTFLEKLNVIEERKAIFNQKVNLGGNLIGNISTIMAGIVYGMISINLKSTADQVQKKILLDIYNEKMKLLVRDYFAEVYSLFRTKFNVRHNKSKTTDIDFDLTELKKPTANYIDAGLLTEMKKKFHHTNSSWNYFSNRFFNFSVFKNADFKKFYLTLDLWDEDEKNKKITLNKEKLQKFNKLLKHLTDSVTDDFTSKEFLDGTKFIFSVKFNLDFDDMATDIDNVVIHYIVYSQYPNSKKIENFLKELKTNTNFKDIVIDRSTNSSSYITIDKQEFKIKRTSFGKDVTLQEPNDPSKVDHQSDSQVKARIIDFWLRVLFLTLNKKSINIEDFNVKKIFLHVPAGISNDLFEMLDSQNNKTKIKKQTINNELSSIRNNFLNILMKIYNSTEMKSMIDLLNDNKINTKSVESKYYDLTNFIVENHKSEFLKEIIKITNLATDALNAYNGIED